MSRFAVALRDEERGSHPARAAGAGRPADKITLASVVHGAIMHGTERCRAGTAPGRAGGGGEEEGRQRFGAKAAGASGFWRATPTTGDGT